MTNAQYNVRKQAFPEKNINLKLQDSNSFV